MLAKLVDWYRAERPDCASCCFHWQSWDEVGMAMYGDSAVGTKGILKMAFIPPKEGVEHLCRELEAGLPQSEVVITDGFFERTFCPWSTAGSPAAPSSTAPAGADAAAAPANGGPTSQIGRLPLVVAIRPWERGSEAEIHFDPMTDRFLLHHKLRGKPLLPAVVGLEALAEAATLATGRPVVAIRNVELIEGLLFHGDKQLKTRVRVVPDGPHLTCELVSDFFNRNGQLMKKDRLHLRARVEVADSVPPLGIVMPEPPSEFQPFTFQDNGPLYHGPSLHGVKGAIFDAAGWLGPTRGTVAGRTGRRADGPRLAGAGHLDRRRLLRLRHSHLVPRGPELFAARLDRERAGGADAARERALPDGVSLPRSDAPARGVRFRPVWRGPRADRAGRRPPGGRDQTVRRAARDERARLAGDAGRAGCVIDESMMFGRATEPVMTTSSNRPRTMTPRGLARAVSYRYAPAAQFETVLRREVEAWLTRGERAELATWHDETRRRVWLVGRILAKELILTKGGQGSSPAAIEILSLDADGRPTRPRIAFDSAPKSWSLSIAHTERGVLVALAARDDVSIGVDLAPGEPLAENFIRLWFTPAEQQWLREADAPSLASVLWASKEALYKALNAGESFAPRAVELLPGGQASYRQMPVGDYELRSFSLDGHTAVMVAVDRGRALHFSSI